MSEQIDLDALEALYRDDKKRPVGTIGQADALALIAELRQERERVAEWRSRRNEALDEEALLREALTQERERADDLLTANVGLVDAVYATDAALSRAEETIAAIRVARANHPECDKVPDGISCGWKRAVQGIDAALAGHKGES